MTLMKKILVAMAAMAGVVLMAQAPDAARNPLAGNAAAIAAGKQRFSGTCETCHGANAGGGRARH